MADAELAVSKLLDTYKGQFEAALPRHMRIDHFMRCAVTYIKKNPTVGKCTPVSICKSLMDAAQLGLAPDGLLGSAYLVPFNNKIKGDGGDRWEMTCQLIPGYRGLIDLARRSGEILDIQARPVLAGEEFSIDWGRTPPLTHKPNLDANPAENGGQNVRGVYAIAFFKDGGQHLEYMSRAEIEGIQRRSKANGKGFSPWQSDWTEMARKTVVKRLAKYLPLSPELSRAIEIDNTVEEVVKAAEVVADDAPQTRTQALKNRLTHQPVTPLADELAGDEREPELVTTGGDEEPPTTTAAKKTRKPAAAPEPAAPEAGAREPAPASTGPSYGDKLSILIEESEFRTTRRVAEAAKVDYTLLVDAVNDERVLDEVTLTKLEAVGLPVMKGLK